VIQAAEELWRIAAEHHHAKRHSEARMTCEHIIKQWPGHPMANNLMSHYYLEAGQPRRATRTAFIASLHAKGRPWGDITAISRSLLNVGETHLARSVLDWINADALKDPRALIELGRQRSTLEQNEHALKCFLRARELGDDSALLHQMFGIVYSFLGPVEKAAEHCDRAVELAPGYGHAHWSRAQLVKSGEQAGGEERIARMRKALEIKDLPVDSVTFIHYALYREHEALGQLDEAWAAINEGARLRRSQLKFDSKFEDMVFDRLIEANKDPVPEANPDVPTDRTPIFIVGMPRTGTTILERIIGNHPDVTTCGELNDFRMQMQWVARMRMGVHLDGRIGAMLKQVDWTVLGRRFLEKTHWLTGDKKFYSDKHPNNFLYVGMMLRAMPHARVINLRKNPMDACFSNLKELFAPGYYPYSYTQPELAHHYRNYTRLMRHWHSIAPGRILDVRYEDLVSDPEKQAKRLQKFLGLKPVKGMSDITANKKVSTTASTLQIRQPLHTRWVGAWKKYEQQFEPMRLLMTDLIEAYDKD
jgi:tetratricopeptide (TPR) repeat protein